MKKILFITTVIVIFLSGCGGGGGLGGSDFNNIDSQMLEVCNSSNSNALLLVSGDSIKKLSSTTTLRVLTSANGTQRACVLTGSAIVLH